MKNIEVVHKDAMQVTGLVLHTSFENGRHKNEIPPFFHRVLKEHLMEEVPHRINRNQLCLFIRQKDSPEFDYLMGVEVQPGDNPPAGMEQVTLPAGDYARLAIIKRGPQDVGAGFAYIHEQWLPASNYRSMDGPGFVYYDDRFFAVFNREGYAGNPVADLYAPIQPK